MFKQEYQVCFPQTGETEKALFNPSHMRQVCGLLMYQKEQTMVAIKDDHDNTVMIALYENSVFKFFTKTSNF